MTVADRTLADFADELQRLLDAVARRQPETWKSSLDVVLQHWERGGLRLTQRSREFLAEALVTADHHATQCHSNGETAWSDDILRPDGSEPRLYEVSCPGISDAELHRERRKAAFEKAQNLLGADFFRQMIETGQCPASGLAVPLLCNALYCKEYRLVEHQIVAELTSAELSNYLAAKREIREQTCASRDPRKPQHGAPFRGRR